MPTKTEPKSTTTTTEGFALVIGVLALVWATAMAIRVAKRELRDMLPW